ncbi:hypothetical protein FGRMN_1296 [Fusarium graminum]|nr:hypothetical protein FGRMN_1296 [Fusarium graminum]
MDTTQLKDLAKDNASDFEQVKTIQGGFDVLSQELRSVASQIFRPTDVGIHGLATFTSALELNSMKTQGRGGFSDVVVVAMTQRTRANLNIGSPKNKVDSRKRYASTVYGDGALCYLNSASQTFLSYSSNRSPVTQDGEILHAANREVVKQSKPNFDGGNNIDKYSGETVNKARTQTPILGSLLPQSYLTLVIDECSATKPSTEILVTKDTQIIHDNNPFGKFVVTLQHATINQDRKEFQESDHSLVHFNFDTRADAGSFATYVKNGRDRLREMFSRNSFSEERIVYHRYDDFSQIENALRDESFADMSSVFEVTSDAGSLTTLRLKIISSKSEGRREQGYRTIMSRDDDMRSICVDFKFKALKIAQKGFLKSLHDIDIWVASYEYDDLCWHRELILLNSDYERAASDWLNEVDDLIENIKGSKEDPYERVKIAIIDSGLNDGVKSDYKNVIYRDFTPQLHNNSWQRNSSWHGTCCTDIISNMYDEAILFIARVFEEDRANDDKGPLRMAEAINWAIEPPNSVDIISISAGFREYSRELHEAVIKANAAGILVVAAASNWQNVGEVAYPARHNLSTMCIYSTNPGNQSSTFNPEPRSDTLNLAILGEGFPHPAKGGTEPMSGTSMATAAAAGLAARIIDFCRQKDNKDYITRSRDVGTLPGMLSIFKSISKPAGSLRYIAPLDLMRSGRESSPVVNRQRMREIVSRAMEMSN